MLDVGMVKLQPRWLDMTITKRELYSEFIYQNDRYFHLHIAIILTLKVIIILVNVSFFFLQKLL